MAKLSRHDRNMNVDTEAWLLTEVKNLISGRVSRRTRNAVHEVSHLIERQGKLHSPSYVLIAGPWWAGVVELAVVTGRAEREGRRGRAQGARAQVSEWLRTCPRRWEVAEGQPR